MKFILGLKIGMSQIFDKEGNQTSVTIVDSGPCKVLQIKTKEKDGYEAVQIGFKELKSKKIKKTNKQKPFKYLKEFSVLGKQKTKGEKKENVPEYNVGQEFNVSIFEEGDKVKISGFSKGKGFAGGVKKWGFAGRPTTRGTKHEIRAIGSIGSSTPSRVVKGRKMPGRMGSERITVKNLEIIKVDPKNNLLFLKGAVPGRRGTLLEIRGR
jgi:large subunit ribosomal protein L3